MPLQDTSPAYKSFLLQKQGLDPDKYDLSDEGQVTPKATAQPAVGPSLSPAPDAEPLAKPPEPSTSVGGTLLHSAERSAIPTGIGLLGGALGVAAAPETGGLSLLIPLLGGIAGGYAGEKLQEPFLSDEFKQQTALEAQQHSIASTIGNLAPSALAFNPLEGIANAPMNIKNAAKIALGRVGASGLSDIEQAALRNAAVNAGIQGGTDVAQQLISGQPFNFSQAALQTAAGGIMNQPWGLGKMLFPNHAPTGEVQGAGQVQPKPPEVNPYADWMQQAQQFGAIPTGASVNEKGNVIPQGRYTTKKGAEIPANVEGTPVSSVNPASLQSELINRANQMPPIPEAGPDKFADFLKAKEDVTSGRAALEEQTRQMREEASKLQDLLQNNQVKQQPSESAFVPNATGEETSLPKRDYTGVTEQANQEVQGESPADLEARRLEAQQSAQQRPKYQQEKNLPDWAREEMVRRGINPNRLLNDVDLGNPSIREAVSIDPTLSKEEKNNLLNPTPTDDNDPLLLRNASPEYRDAVQQLAAKRGISLKEAIGLTRPETGKEVLGAYNPNDRTALVNPNRAELDTPIHEGTHGYLDDLRNSANPKDRSLYQRALGIFGGDEAHAEEALTGKLGVAGVPRVEEQMHGFALRNFNSWFHDYVARWKNTLGVANDNDVIRHLSARYFHDAPYGSRAELNPSLRYTGFQPGMAGREGFKMYTATDDIKDKEGKVVVPKDSTVSDKTLQAKGINYQENPQIHTPEFKKWFGESKVVDKDNKPLVVYHGTRSTDSIDIINPSQQNQHGKPREAGPTGFWATPSKNYAHNYSFDYKGEGKQSGPIYPVYAKAEKIAGYSSGNFIPDEGSPRGKIKVSNEPVSKEEFVNYVKQFGRYPESSWGLKDGTYLRPRDINRISPETVYDNWKNKGGPNVLDFIPYTHESLASKWDVSNHSDRELMRQILLNHGYDAYWNSGNGRGELAFLKGGEQIKSAIGNKGTFDTTNPDIRYQDHSNLLRPTDVGYNDLTPSDKDEYIRLHGEAMVARKEHEVGAHEGTADNLIDKELALKKFSEDRGMKYQEESQMKLGLPKDLSQKNTEAEQEYKQLPITRSANDTILAKEGARAKPFIKAINDNANQRSEDIARYKTSYNQSVEGLTDAEKNHVEEVLMRENRDKAFHNDELNPKEQEAYGGLRNTIRNMQEHRIEANQPVKAVDAAGHPFYRQAKIDPYYWPNQISPKAIEALEKGNTPMAEQLRSDWEEFQKAHKVPDAEAKSSLDSILGSYNKATPNLAHFRGVDIEQGHGLPDSFMRPGLDRNMDRYINRFATARAYHDNIESNPQVASLIGEKTTPWGKPIENPEKPLSSSVAKDVIHRLKGQDYNPEESNFKGAARIASATMLGPQTNVHVLGSTVANTLGQAVMPKEVAGMVTHMVSDFRQAAQHAIDLGNIRQTRPMFKGLFDAHATTAERMNIIADGISRLQGRNLTDYISKATSQAANEWLVKNRIELARAGDKASVRFMQGLDSSWSPEKAYSDKEKIQLAGDLSNRLHGVHDSRTQPNWMLKDNIIQPFTSLMGWSVAQTNNFMKHVITPASQGDYRPLLMNTLGAVLGGYVIKQGREMLANKKSPIPSFQDIAAAPGGIGGHIPLDIYNLLAMTSFAGYGGIMSMGARSLFDLKYKNPVQGSVFPLDEALSNTFGTVRDAASALMNSHDLNETTQIALHAGADFLKGNAQGLRIAMNWAAPEGLLGAEKQRQFNLSQEEGDLRRWKTVEGMPTQPIDTEQANPYLNLNRKMFQRNMDISDAASKLPALIQQSMEESGGNIDVLKSKLQALKDGAYPSMPSIEHTPRLFFNYVKFLNDTQGPEAAAQRVSEYMKNNMVNKIKGSMVPNF